MIKKISYPNRDEWLELRRQGIGGSDAAAVAGLSQWSSPLSVYADKLGLVPKIEDNEAMRQGRDLEDYVAQRFCEAAGRKVRRENHILINDDLPFMHANIDRKVVGEQAGLECKTTSVYNKSDFENGDIPPYYYVQCQHYMAVTGYKVWYLAVLILNRKFYWFKIERNEDDIKALIEIEKDFWENHVIKQIPPEPMAQDDDTIKVLFPAVAETYVPLNHISRRLRNLIQKKSQMKALEQEIKAEENLIKMELGEAVSGSDGEITVTWKERVSNRFDSKRFKKDHPDLYEKYLKQISSRTFLIKEENKSIEEKIA